MCNHWCGGVSESAALAFNAGKNTTLKTFGLDGHELQIYELRGDARLETVPSARIRRR